MTRVGVIAIILAFAIFAFLFAWYIRGEVIMPRTVVNCTDEVDEHYTYNVSSCFANQAIYPCNLSLTNGSQSVPDQAYKVLQKSDSDLIEDIFNFYHFLPE